MIQHNSDHVVKVGHLKMIMFDSFFKHLWLSLNIIVPSTTKLGILFKNDNPGKMMQNISGHVVKVGHLKIIMSE
jgi:hypothetical protein